MTISLPTSSTQALLYRLASRDLNPIHADPVAAKKVALPRPILHGLCTFGYAARALTSSLGGGDPTKIAQIAGRFTKPVFPGETLETDVWRIGEREARFQVRSKERGDVVIDLGFARTTP